jgi:hypothetical protein
VFETLLTATGGLPGEFGFQEAVENGKVLGHGLLLAWGVQVRGVEM